MPKSQQEPKEKVCLICIDGWGVSPVEDPKGDAIRNAETPVMDKFKKDYPYADIAAHGLSVGLPDGLMGNSEVGHLNIGAGRVVYQVSLNDRNKGRCCIFIKMGFLGHCSYRSCHEGEAFWRN